MRVFGKGSIYDVVKQSLSKTKDLKEVVKGGSSAFVINIVGLIFGYAFIWLISKIYQANSAAIYGQYVLIGLILRIGSIFSRLGADTTMLRYSSGLLVNNLWGNILQIFKQLRNFVLATGVLVTLIGLICSHAISDLLHLPHRLVVNSCIFISPMALGLFYSQSLRGLKNIKVSTFLRMSSLPVFNFFLLLVSFPFLRNFSFFKDLPVYTCFISVLLTLFIGNLAWKKAFIKVSNYAYDKSESKSLKVLLKTAYALMFFESITFITTWIEQLMIGILGTATDVGIYNVCNRYTMAALIPLVAINQSSAPKFSEFFTKKKYEELGQIVQQTTKFISFASLPVVLALIIFPKFFLGIFGSAYTEGALALIFLCFGVFINVVTGSVDVLLNMTGHEKTSQKIVSITLLVGITLNAILIPIYGIVGAAITSAVTQTLKNLLFTYYVKKYFGFYGIYIPKFLTKNR